MSTRKAHCYSCREASDIDDLDAKPTPTLWLFCIELLFGQRHMLSYAGDRGYEFDHLECSKCYGPACVAWGTPS